VNHLDEINGYVIPATIKSEGIPISIDELERVASIDTDCDCDEAAGLAGLEILKCGTGYCSVCAASYDNRLIILPAIKKHRIAILKEYQNEKRS
jgi:hypothetical protein